MKKYATEKHKTCLMTNTTDNNDGFTPDFTITGSVSEIKQGLALVKIFEQLLKKLDIQGGGGSYRPIPNYATNKCLVTVYFKGRIQNVNKEHYVDKSFRWVKKDPKTVTLQELTALGTAIKNKFDNFSFFTGTQTYSYNSPEQGFYKIWGHYSSLQDAQRVIESLLDLQQMSPEWERLSHSNVPLPGSRFNEPPEKVQIAGQLVRSRRERPVASMKFYKSEIVFPQYLKPISLVDKNGNVISKLPFSNDD